MMKSITTSRLILRPLADSDLDSLAELNQDSQVMRYFPSLLSREESQQFLSRVQEKYREEGFSFLACELKSTHEMIGFVGLNQPSFESHFTPCVEIGWRIAKPFWRQGYAFEAAQRMLEVAFNEMHLDEVVAFTVRANQPSRALMEKLGMTHNVQDDFQHPSLPLDHPLSWHVLYRVATHQR